MTIKEIVKKISKRCIYFIRLIISFLSSTKPIPELEHLPFGIFAAISEISKNKLVNQRIQNGYYADKLIIVAGIGNSASTVLGQCVSEITGRPRGYGSYMMNNSNFNLRPEMVRDFINGGVYRNHFSAHNDNIKVLETLKAKYIINFRNPIDIIAAKYCVFSTKHYEYIKNNQRLQAYYYSVPRNIFSEGHKMHDAINYLITEGYLNATMSWIADWLDMRDPDKSIVVNYEEIKLNPASAMNRISNFFMGCEISDTTLENCNKLIQLNGEQAKKFAVKYPRGWTGKVGAWKNYFSDDNLRKYRKQVQEYLSFHPKASLILEVYPNILEIDA